MSRTLLGICRHALTLRDSRTTRQLSGRIIRPCKNPLLNSWFASAARLRSAEPAALASAPSEVASSFALRPYQEECIQDCLSAISSGVTRIGVSSPTGSGKTTIFTHLIDRLPSRPNGGDRVLVMVNSVELAIQAADSITAAFPEKSVEIEQGSKYKASGFADVTVATYQTLNRSRGRLEKLDPDMFKAVIVDEAHHAAAPSYLNVLSYFDPLIGVSEKAAASSSPETTVPIIGFSATFSRHDGLALSKVFDRIVFHKDFLEMIGEKWLSPIRFTSIKADIDLTSVQLSNFQSDFKTSSLASVVNTPVVNRIMLKAWIDKAYEVRKSTLVFAVNIEHVQDLTETFRGAGIDARYLHGGTPMPERRQLLQDFRAGLFPVLVNCAILTEGADVPSIDCVLLARPTRSRNLFSQMIGRGLRLSPKTGKKDCLILDIVGNVDKGVVCTPTLFGLNVDEVIEDETSESLLERQQEAKSLDDIPETDADGPQVAEPTKVVYIDYDDPFQLQQAMQARTKIVETMSPNAWVDCGDQHYILEIPRYGFIRVEPTEEKVAMPSSDPTEIGIAKWTAWYVASNSDVEEARASQGLSMRSTTFARTRRWGQGASPYRKPRHVLLAQDLETAVRGCDLYAKRNVLGNSMQLYSMLNRRAAWRQAKASDSQRKLIEKRLGRPDKSTDVDDAQTTPKRSYKDLDTSTMTKGQASNILARLKHGAKGRWQQKAKSSNRLLRMQEQEKERIERQTVRVGPLI